MHPATLAKMAKSMLRFFVTHHPVWPMGICTDNVIETRVLEGSPKSIIVG